EALADAGAVPPPVVRGDWSAESGFAAGAALGATAVFCANDQMALGLLRAVAESGRAVPSDVSVVGFDDIPEAANFLPPLTTVRQDFPALAQQAVTALIAAVEGDATATDRAAPVVVPTRLVERASTAHR
ncbi:LacI family transcriptional regulator, partial [Microbacterium sp. HSID17254]